MISGPTAILAMTSGFLISGAVISKFKPRPLYLLSWNVIVGFSFVLGEISFIFLSCEDSNMVGFRKGDQGYVIKNSHMKLTNVLRVLSLLFEHVNVK